MGVWVLGLVSRIGLVQWLFQVGLVYNLVLCKYYEWERQGYRLIVSSHEVK